MAVWLGRTNLAADGTAVSHEPCRERVAYDARAEAVVASVFVQSNAVLIGVPTFGGRTWVGTGPLTPNQRLPKLVK